MSDGDFVPVRGNVFEYTTDIHDICMGRVQAIFSDGSISPEWMEFLFVPGQEARVDVHDGYFSLSGSDFYSQWRSAGVLFDNLAPDDVFSQAKKYVDSPAYMCYVFYKGLLPQQKLNKLYGLMPKALKTGFYGRFFDHYK